jgi:hypothetical protein
MQMIYIQIILTKKKNIFFSRLIIASKQLLLSTPKHQGDLLFYFYRPTIGWAGYIGVPNGWSRRLAIVSNCNRGVRNPLVLSIIG